MEQPVLEKLLYILPKGEGISRATPQHLNSAEIVVVSVIIIETNKNNSICMERSEIVHNKNDIIK